mmetsp:Transcript_7792/g.15613  ORF Transcript_7792/g.15613 Transcript_7792/m.15613 type:complete len:215 (-) Transcript_7792:1635-2279(-)
MGIEAERESQVSLTVYNSLERLLLAVCLEGSRTAEHLIDQYPTSPVIDGLIVPPAEHNLRCHVLGRATKGEGSVLRLAMQLVGDLLGESKVSNLQIPKAIHQQILRLQVPVAEAPVVDVLKSTDTHCAEEHGTAETKSSPLAHAAGRSLLINQRPKLSSWHVLKQQVDLVTVTQGAPQLNNEGMVHDLHGSFLPSNVLLLLRPNKMSFSQAFQR